MGITIHAYDDGDKLMYMSIDGNWIKKPVAFCTRYRGMLSEKQIKLHGCRFKFNGQCKRLRELR